MCDGGGGGNVMSFGPVIIGQVYYIPTPCTVLYILEVGRLVSVDSLARNIQLQLRE